MEYKSNETHIKEHFGDMMTINAFSMNNSPVGLIEQKTFDYKKHFVDFFEYMSNHCSTKNTEYTNANYLRKKMVKRRNIGHISIMKQVVYTPDGDG